MQGQGAWCWFSGVWVVTTWFRSLGLSLKKLFLETFGCQMNVLDSELVLQQLRGRGYALTEARDEADLILYNTCSVREHAEQKVWSRLGELRAARQDRPGLLIGVIGCMAEREGTDLLKRYPHVDILCGPGELDKLPALVENAAMNALVAGARQRQVALMGSTSRRSSTREAAEDNLELLDLSRSISPSEGARQAYVRITRGCNKFCSYCVVPYTRGPEVHRPPQNIIAEVKRLVDAGVLEVTLLGQTVNHYAYKHGDGRVTSFAQLLHAVHEATPSLPRLRFVTSFPRDFTDEALQVMRDDRRICHYLHIPAQSGSDRILRMMNRGYTAGEYRELIDRARGYMPDICLASDFIVGFPTETEEEFQTSVELIRYCRFKNSFIFKYSPRPDTHAAERHADDVPEEVKRRRNNELLAVQGEVSAANNAEMVGKTVEVMVEGTGSLVSPPPAAGQVELGWEKRPGGGVQMIGRTRGDQIVAFPGTEEMKGKLLEVRITGARQMTLFGEVVGV
jgi:tRNA-2-methylthio-N6-dimethylallyladenosine synthase